MFALLNGADPRSNPDIVRAALLKVRRQVPDLSMAKSTFFALTDDHGVAVRNDLEQDVMAGKDVLLAYPELSTALRGKSFVSTQGHFATPNPAGPDEDWVAAVPVTEPSGKVLGLLVTGWPYRRFAYHLEESLKHDLQQAASQGAQGGKMPVVYVGLFDKNAVYTARGTPPVNERALADLHLVDATASGPSQGTLKITGRAFGWAAVRLPRLGSEVGVVVLRSEI